MSDLLLQGRSKLLENGDAASRSLPMFRTGSGKSVALKQSSVAKALSVLGDEDGDDFPDPGCSRLLENGDAALQSLPMFQTGSGKSVALKQSSIAKALSVLGDEDGDDFPDPGCSKLLENGDAASRSLPMFRTGSGKSVALKKSSIAKALSVLGDEDGDDFPDPGQEHVRDFRPDRSSFLFQTGSGKVVSASPTGMERAKTLLGLEEGTDQHDFAGLRPTRRPPIVNNTNRCQLASHLDRKEGLVHADALHSLSAPSISFTCGTSLVETKLKDSGNCSNMQTKMCDIPSKPAPIKFQTAGGRSISISGDALKRARSLLGDPELGDFLNEGNFDSRPFSFLNERETGDNLSNKENDSSMSFLCQGTPKRNHKPNGFITPLRSSSNKACYPKVLEKPSFGDNLINKFDAAVCDSTDTSNFDVACLQKPLTTRSHSSSPVIGKSLANGIGPGMNPHVRLSGGSLMDISNRIDITCSGAGKVETRRLKKASFVSPFKRPRSSAFSSPLKSDRLFSSSGLSTSLAKQSLHKGKVSSRYPSQIPRVYVSEYFAGPPQEQNTHIPDQLRRIKPDNAHKFVFTNESGLNGIGAEAFLHMLVQSGASTQHISKGWVTNHYRWIIWKLASYERYYPATTGKFLTTTNVLEELKYRYEREINHGHRSAIKRILEGDASPAAMLVLCVSAIHADDNLKTPSSTTPSNGTLNNNAMRLELTDGWYSVDALLDDLLSKHLMEKKIYIGQKIRIWGARLGGWAAPVSPLEETRTVTLLLHANGTYRAHWADRLGFCKGAGAPLAFRCIKSNGGPIPMTLVGVTRIYPILYRERFCSGDSIVRSERMEMKIRQLYNQRRSLVIEGAVSEFQRSTKDFLLSNDSDSEEGAKILKLLEMSAEPEVLMAEMSPDQLNSFAAYRSRLEVTRQSDMEKSIEKALQDAGLTEREVTAFMRVRVVGLKRTYHGKSSQEEGFITIWNPTEKQQNDLIEGQAYAITGLVPVKSNSETIYLQAKGPTTKWQHLSSREVENFEPFFSPRKAISLSNLGEIPLSSEFDIAAFVLYVGEVYTTANQKRQWIFVTDGSKVEMQAGEYDTSLLAISFFFPPTDDNSFVPINYNLVGSTVGFCNLIKRAKDQMNHLWVAEATENSNYFLSFDPPHFCHLKEAALSTHGWAKVSELIIDELKERVLFIIGGCKN